MKGILDNRKILSTIFGLLITAFVLLTIVFGQNLLKLLKIGYSANVDSGVTIYAGFSEKDIHPTYENVSNYYETSYKPTHPNARPIYKDSNNHFVLPLEGFGKSYARKGYSECTYEYYDSTTISYLCSEDETYSNPLKATTVVFYDGSKYYITVSFDSIHFTDWFVEQLRNEIYSTDNLKDTINKDNSLIIFSVTHAHSTPGVGFLIDSNKNKYPDLYHNVYYYKIFVYSQIKASIREAINNMYEADLSYSSIDVKDENNRTLNFIRHYRTTNVYKNGDLANRDDNHGNYAWDGTHYIANNTYDSERPHMSLPDTTMQLLKINYSEEIKSEHNVKDILLINWQAHPVSVGGGDGKVISADYVGDLRKYLKSQPNFNYNVSYINGAAGNLNNRTFLKQDSDEALVNRQYSDVVPVTIHSTKNKVQASQDIGSKLGEYVITALNNSNGFKKVNVDKININSQRIRYDYKDKVANDTIFYNNAYYVYKIHMASISEFKEMVEGTYNWQDDYFNINFDLINYSEHGPELAQLLINVSESNAANKIAGFGTNVYTIVANSSKPSGYEINIGPAFYESTKNSLLNIIGVDLDNLETEEDERIYSRVHGDRIVEVNKYYDNGSNLYRDVEIDAISIGDFSFATIPNEPFDTIGKAIKKDTKSSMTFIMGYTNGAHGYLPNKESFEYGSYEADNSIYKKGTAEKVQNQLINMIRDISIKKLEWDTLPSNIQELASNDGILHFVGGSVKITYANGSSEIVELNSLKPLSITGVTDPDTGKEIMYLAYRNQQLVINLDDEIASHNLEIDEEVEKWLEENSDVKTIDEEKKDNDKKIYGTTDNPKTFRQTIFTTIISFVLLIVTGIMLYKVNKKMAINTL